MSKTFWIAAGVAALLWYNKNTVQSIMLSSSDAITNLNVLAFLGMIRNFESAGRYDVLYGGGRFTDYSAHPHVKVPFVNPARAPHPDGSANDFSTAAGAYQINWPTWCTVYPLISASDFTPAAQDQAAIQLLKMNGALALIIAGDFNGAINAASGTWASLPASTSGQHKVGLQTALNAYTNNGGLIA